MRIIIIIKKMTEFGGGLNSAVNSWAIGAEMWFSSLLECKPILGFIYKRTRNVANFVG